MVEEPAIEIEPENKLSVEVFFGMATQWRSNGFGPTGLDYLALGEVMRFKGIATVASTFDDIQILEREAMRVMRERRDLEERKAKAAKK